MDSLQIITCFALTGLIWIIQLVHYPAFRYIEASRFPKFHQMHSRKISFVVIPLMIAELITAIWLAFSEASSGYFQSIILLLTLLVWLSTFGLQVPCHSKMTNGKDLHQIEKLILTNWIRTLAWSAKSAMLAWQIMAAGS